MTPERRAELRRDYPRPPENARPDTSVVRREVNELLDALDKQNDQIDALHESLDSVCEHCQERCKCKRKSDEKPQ